MIWQTTWERHHWQAISRLLSEQLGEGEIELRMNCLAEKSMPHGICAMQDMIFRQM